MIACDSNVAAGAGGEFFFREVGVGAWLAARSGQLLASVPIPHVSPLIGAPIRKGWCYFFFFRRGSLLLAWLLYILYSTAHLYQYSHCLQTIEQLTSSDGVQPAKEETTQERRRSRSEGTCPSLSNVAFKRVTSTVQYVHAVPVSRYCLAWARFVLPFIPVAGAFMPAMPNFFFLFSSFFKRGGCFCRSWLHGSCPCESMLRWRFRSPSEIGWLALIIMSDHAWLLAAPSNDGDDGGR